MLNYPFKGHSSSLTKVFRGLCQFRKFSDETRRLLVVRAEGKDSLVGGVGCGATFTGQRGVEK